MTLARLLDTITIGLFENFGHPEVVIFGMNPQVRHSILNWIGKNVQEGNPFAAGREHDWVLEGHNCWSRDVQKLWYKDLFGWAIWFYGGTEFPMVQCLWPAKVMIGCSVRVTRRTNLSRNPEIAARLGLQVRVPSWLSIIERRGFQKSARLPPKGEQIPAKSQAAA